MPKHTTGSPDQPDRARSPSWYVLLPLVALSTLIASYWVFAYWMLTLGPPGTSFPLASQGAATGAPFITIVLGHIDLLAFWIAFGALLLLRFRIFIIAYLLGASIRATSWIFQSFNPDFPSEIGFFQIGLEATVVWLFLRWRQEANPPSLDA